MDTVYRINTAWGCPGIEGGRLFSSLTKARQYVREELIEKYRPNAYNDGMDYIQPADMAADYLLCTIEEVTVY